MNRPNLTPTALKTPYIGLRPFEAHENELFFGRAEQIESMLARLEVNRFLAVVGASGCGKSSLVRAGLLPALADGFLMGAGNDWRFVIARPGDDPFANLAHAIVDAVDGPHLLKPPVLNQEDAGEGRDPYNLALVESALLASRTGLGDALAQCEIPETTAVLVLIDQFEELFRFREHQSKATSGQKYKSRNDALAFVELLLQSLQRSDRQIYVLITMRSDFLGACDEFPDLPEAISVSQFLTPRMTRSQLSEAITGPLEAIDCGVEAGFVNRILNDVGSDPDQLPLMQHALLRTWQRTQTAPVKDSSTARASRPTELRITDYEAVGGVNGALDQHAELIFEGLGDATNRELLQHVAERLFCCLSDQREGSPLTRRPRTVSQVALEVGVDEKDIEEVVRAFQEESFLVFSPPGQPLDSSTRLDIGHESLLRQWSRLQKWIESESRLVFAYRRLLDALRSREKLLSDTHLDQAQEWQAKRCVNVHWAMRYDGADQPGDTKFQQCCDLIEASRKDRQRRFDEELAAEEREQKLLREKAEFETQRALEAQADARRFRRRTRVALLACGLAVFFLGFALVNLWKANSATQSALENEKEATIAKQEADQAQASTSRQNADHYWRFATIARDAKMPDNIKAAHLFLKGANSLTAIVPELQTITDKTAVSTDGLAAYVVAKPLLRSWVHDGTVHGAQFSRDESRVLTWSNDNTARVWDIARAEPLQTFKHDAAVIGAQFSRNESRVLTWSSDNTARVWDVTEAKPLRTFKHDGPVAGAQFSRDESCLLTWSNDNTVRVWDAIKAEPIQTFKHEDAVGGAQFSSDESRVLTWCYDKKARVWDVAKAEPLQTFTHDDHVSGATFSRDAASVLTWSYDNTAWVWDVTKAEPLQTFKHDGPVRGAQFSRDASCVLTWSNDNTARVWDVTKAQPLQTFTHEDAVRGALFSRDESRVLTWSNDNTARVWDVTKAEPLQTFKHDGPVTGAQFSRDESHVLTRSDDTTTRVWDATKAEPLHTFKHEDAVRGAQFSRDESRVLTWGDDNTARVWDMTKANPIQIFKHENSVLGAQFSRDESRMLTQSDDNTARVWDVITADPLQIFKHDGPVYGAQFSRDESRVLTWSYDKTARVWDVTKAAPVQTFEHGRRQVKGAQYSRDESCVLTWSDDNAQVWDVTKAEPLQTFKHKGALGGAQFSSDASRVLTWSLDNTAHVWEVTNAEPLQTFKHDGPISGALFSRDESRVLTWSDDKTARVWEVNKAKQLQSFKHDGTVYGAQFSRDESRVLTWSADGTARFWDANKDEPIQTFKHDSSDVRGARFTLDESGVLTWSGDGTVRVWDVTKAEPLQIFKHVSGVTGALFNRDESRVLTWSYATTSLWDVTKAEPLQSFKHDGTVYGAQYSRDELHVLTWSRDNTARIWSNNDPLEKLTPADRLLELEVRSGTTIDQNQNLRVLKFGEWIGKAKSSEYQAIAKALEATITASSQVTK